MQPGTIRPLTDRQRAVMERIDRRIPIKVIAGELGVSETRINQHIRALKDIYGAASLFELVSNYRISQGRSGDDLPPEGAGDDAFFPDLAEPPFSEPVYSKKQIPETLPFADEWPQDDAAKLVIGDVMPLVQNPGWLMPGEPRVVPGLLEGEHAVPLRLLAMVLIAAGILAAVILTVTAAVSLSKAMEGKADVPVDQWNSAA
jgi:DNA-binding CsgD family transcriptional regulator